MDSDKLLLVLDLDETLIHARESPLERPADLRVFGFHVYLRPHVERFLAECAARFRLAVWSSASERYVEAIVQHLFPPERRPELVWGRGRCTFTVDHARRLEEGGMDSASHYEYAKKLSKLKRLGFRLERMLIVDDTPAKCLHNYGNAIYVRPFEGQEDDAELPALSDYLATLAEVPNVRVLEKRGWRNPRG
ncbi:NIF family HAD-type phosphatase [Corallococcus terminator]